MTTRGEATTGSLRERRPGVWELRVGAGRDPASGKYRQQHKTVHGTERQARRALAALVGDVDGGRRPRATGTLAELLAQWLAQAEADLSPSTMREYRRLVDRRILPALGARPLAKVTVVELEDFYRGLVRSGLGAGSVRQVHAIIRKAMTEAMRWGWVTANPAAHARAPRVKRADIAPPSPDQLQQLLLAAAVDDPAFELFLRLAATTGARRGELCALRWSAVDLDVGEVLIERALVEIAGGGVIEKDTKTHAKRRLAIGASTTVALAGHRAVVEQRARAEGGELVETAYVFSVDFDGRRPWRPDHVTKAFVRLTKREGVSARLHDLRHFTATQLLANGTDVGTVADRLGHRDAAVTLNVYRHHVPAAGRAASDFMDGLVGRRPIQPVSPDAKNPAPPAD